MFSALTSKVGKDEKNMPETESVDDFELCREIKEKGRLPTGKYEVLQGEEILRNIAQAWEVFYIRFKQSGAHIHPTLLSEIVAKSPIQAN